MKHLSSALTAIRRSPYQALAAILVLSITFFVGYTFSLFLYGSEMLLRFFETRPQVTAYFELTTTPETIQRIEQTMKEKTYVDKVTTISKEKALEIYQRENTDPLLLELVSAEILPASIEVSGKTVDALLTIREDLENAEGVDEVMYHEEVITNLQKWTQALRYVGLASVAILAITSFLIIVIISGMKVALKKRAITIMRILGATKWYVKAPFVFEGMIYGLIGSGLGWGMMYTGLLYLTPYLKEFFQDIPLFPLPNNLLLAQVGIGTGAALLLGAFASSFAVQRMMRRA